MSSGTPTVIERDPRTLVLLGLSLLIFWLGAAVRNSLPLAPPLLRVSSQQSGFVRAGEGAPEAVSAPEGNPASLALVSFQPISINQADTEALIALDGIGPVLAGRIVKQRSVHGRFRNADDLLAVHGIGPKKLAKILPQITFD
jgi:competence protein ComEA